jgi:thioredoxin 1
MATIDVSQSNFEQTIQNDIVIVDCWTSWCGPCKAFAPVFETASDQHKDITFAKLDTEAEPSIAQAFQIRAIPTLLIFREQILLGAQAGALAPNDLESLIQQVKDLDMDSVRAQIAAQKK